MPDLFTHSHADMDQQERYRYTLTRTWDVFLPGVLWIMLNPSTADSESDDPTIRRCIAYSKAWGAGCLCVVNLFAFRATNPKELLSADDPVGLHNDQWIKSRISAYSKPGDIILAAWGNHGSHPRMRDRRNAVLRMLPVADIQCLDITKTGDPKHPLYCRADLVPNPYEFPEEAFHV